jgi:hypothetical protein
MDFLMIDFLLSLITPWVLISTTLPGLFCQIKKFEGLNGLKEPC